MLHDPNRPSLRRVPSQVAHTARDIARQLLAEKDTIGAG